MSSKLAKIVADFRTTLSTQINVGGTTGTLQAYLDADGNAIPDGNYFFTLDGSNSQKEHIFCAVASGSLSSIKSVSRQGVQTSGCARLHRIGATVEITDFAHLRYINDLVSAATGFDSSTPLFYDAEPTWTLGNHQLVTWDKSKAYTDSVAISGAPASSHGTAGILKKATVTETQNGTDNDGTYFYAIPVGITVVTSAGAGDAWKLPVLGSDGKLDESTNGVNRTRTWTTVQTFPAADLQINTDGSSANDAVRFSLLQSYSSSSLAVGTSGEAFAVGAALYLKASDSKLYKAAGTGDESTFSFAGIAQSVSSGANASVTYARPGGIATGLTGLTAGSYYYVTDTAGTIGTTPGTRFAKIGQALSTTTLRVTEPKFIRSGTSAISAVGSTTITTGFYPARVVVNGGNSVMSGTGLCGISVGDDTNNCSYIPQPSGSNGNNTSNTAHAWFLVNGSSNKCSGTIDTKTQTGFNLNCDAYDNQGNASTRYLIQWTAFSE